MIQRREIKKGLPVRLLSDHMDVPAGTRATVDDLGIMSDVWWFTVRFSTYKPITPPWSGLRRKRPIRHNNSSLRLWERNLTMFELVTETEIESTPSTASPPSAPRLPASWRRRGLGRNTSVHPNQLSLFLADDL